MICIIRDCDSLVRCRGLCHFHYHRLMNGRDMDTPKGELRRVNFGNCSVENCDRSAEKRGFCGTHYQRWRNGLDLSSPLKRIASKGSGRINSEQLGRPLNPGENVHHKNGVRADNRIENLELWVVSQPKGQRPEDLVEWAKEILSTYEPSSLHHLALIA